VTGGASGSCVSGTAIPASRAHSSRPRGPASSSSARDAGSATRSYWLIGAARSRHFAQAAWHEARWVAGHGVRTHRSSCPESRRRRRRSAFGFTTHAHNHAPGSRTRVRPPRLPRCRRGPAAPGRPEAVKAEVAPAPATYSVEQCVNDWLASIERDEHTMQTMTGQARPGTGSIRRSVRRSSRTSARPTSTSSSSRSPLSSASARW